MSGSEKSKKVVEAVEAYNNHSIRDHHMEDMYQNVDEPWGGMPKDQSEVFEELETHGIAEKIRTGEIPEVMIIGAGVGKEVPVYLALNPAIRIVAIDISITALKKLQAQFPMAEFLPLDMGSADIEENLKSLNPNFQFLVARDVLYYFADYRGALERIIDLMPSGSLFLIGDCLRRHYVRTHCRNKVSRFFLKSNFAGKINAPRYYHSDLFEIKKD